MDPNELNDRQLKEQLAPGPLTRNGFDARLRARIEKRIGEERRRTVRMPWLTAWRLAAAALASITVVLLGVWVWHSGIPGERSTGDSGARSAMSDTASSASSAQQPHKYALLIGLRADTANGSANITSRYRTVLVAPEEERIRLISDNEGLYVPFKTKFWKISAFSIDNGRQVLQAVELGGKNNNAASVSVPDSLLSERVLFAGNQYVSVSSTVRDGKPGSVENVWVKRIDQVNQKAADAAHELHIRLQEAVPEADAAYALTQQWRIVRDPGRWVAYTRGASGDEERLPTPLPPAVINEDTLNIDWQHILRIEPAARDAFTYGNMLAVIGNQEIRVHEVKEGTVSPNSVTIPLASHESLVMVQWAGGGYVNRWIADMRTFAGK